PAAAAEATGPELPLGADPALTLAASHSSSPLDASEEEADRAVAGLTEIEDEVVSGEGGDEPLLAEALGVDLVVDGDEPVPAPPPRRPPPGRRTPPRPPGPGGWPRPPPRAASPPMGCSRPGGRPASPRPRPPGPRTPPPRRSAGTRPKPR